MQISIAILVGVNRIKSYIEKLIKAFKSRVLSYPNSIFEAEACLVATLRSLNAIGLLDNASLVITPNAYTEGILYDVIPNTTLGDMTVVRATTATRVNSAGLIEVVPRNLFTYSEQFDNFDWVKTNLTVTANATTAPNGTLTAEKLVATAIDSNHILSQSLVSFISNIAYSFSYYAKAAEYTKCGIRIGGPGYATTHLAAINLTNGSIISQQGFTSLSVTLINNGWYRILGTFTSATGLTPNIQPLSDSYTIVADNFSYLGNGTSGIFAWGAQTEKGSTATEYFPTTTRLNIPRIDYTNGSCPSLLVEPQRTNLALNSDGNLSTYPTAINVTNASSSFNSFTNAIQFPSTALALAYKTVITTAQTYAISVFIKMDDNSVPIIGTASNNGNLCLIIAGNIATNNLKVESYGNNVYRLSGTATSLAINGNNGLIRYDTQVLKSFKITGIQLEAGAYPTSYIPTIASTVTRNADVISKTGISSLIGQTEGTIFVDANLSVNVNERRLISVSNGTETQRIIIWTLGTVLYATFNTMSVTLGNFPIGRTKIAVGYTISGANTIYNIKVNNNSLVSGSVVAAPNPLNSINIGANTSLGLFLQDSINSIQIYKTALSTTELQSLTTL